MPIDITIENLTSNVTTSVDNVVTGDGIFDDLMETVNTHIEAQYNKGRIKGPEYATVYLGALQTVLSQSIQFVLSAKLQEAQVTAIAADVAVKEAQELDIIAAKDLKVQQKVTEADKLATSSKQRDVMAAQESLYARQELGFDDNKKLKLFEAQLDVFGMAWSSVGGFGTAEESDLPDAFTGTQINSLYEDLSGLTIPAV